MAHHWKCLLCSFLCFFFLSELLWQLNIGNMIGSDNNVVYQTVDCKRNIHLQIHLWNVCGQNTASCCRGPFFRVSFKEFQSWMGRRVATLKAYIQVHGEYFIIDFYQYTLKWIIFMLQLHDWELTCGRFKPVKCEIPRIWADSGDWVPN